jgi:hypothetical protein
VARDKAGVRVGLHVPGLYEKIRAKELKLALAPDPRLYGLTGLERVAAALNAPKYSPTVLYQVEALLAYEPVRVPRWMLGGRPCPQARGWAAYEDRRHPWFILSPDDTLVPADYQRR